MAVVVHPIVVFDGLFRLEVEYDDTLLASTGDADLIRGVVTNLSGSPVQVQVFRNTGANWRNVLVPAGVTVFPAGGPVSKLSHLSRWTVSMVY